MKSRFSQILKKTLVCAPTSNFQAAHCVFDCMHWCVWPQMNAEVDDHCVFDCVHWCAWPHVKAQVSNHCVFDCMHWCAWPQVNAEVDDMYKEFQREKEDLLESIRMLQDQMQLKDMVIEAFTPPEEVQKVRVRVYVTVCACTCV